jgi:hypothetical protein
MTTKHTPSNPPGGSHLGKLMNSAPTPAYARMAKVLRENSPYHFCLACRQVATPINYGEANLQRCEHCDSSRITFYDRPSVNDYALQAT